MALTFEQIKTEVTRLATDYPNAVYRKQAGFIAFKTCFYTIGKCGNGVGCIFGQALCNLDPTLRTKLVEVDRDDTTDSEIGTVLPRFGVVLTGEQSAWCTRVQSNQDSGSTWSSAVRQANDSLVDGLVA